MEAKKQKKLTPTQEKSRQKKLVEIVKDLQSSEDVVVLDALEKVKEHGDASVIPHLVTLLTSNENQSVKDLVRSILKGLKDQTTIPALFSSINDENLSDVNRAFLTSVFWEAGLDTKDHLDELIDIAIKYDMVTCIEVMTIVENLEGIDNELVEKNILKLKAIYDREKSEKDTIYISILDILNNHLIG